MAEDREIIFVTGLDTGATPDQSQFFLMAMNQDAPNFNFDMNYMGDSSMQGFAHHPLRRRLHPQVPVGFVNSIVGLDAGATPDQVVAYMMATIDDPRSSGGKFIRSDRRNKGKSNYPPQIGA